MKIYYHTQFQREYKKLSESLRELTKERGKIFEKDPFDHRLKTHKLGGKYDGYWGFWINQKYRVIFMFQGQETAWFHSVGDHDIYKKKL